MKRGSLDETSREPAEGAGGPRCRPPGGCGLQQPGGCAEQLVRGEEVHHRPGDPRGARRHVLGQDPERCRAGREGPRHHLEVLQRPGRGQAGDADPERHRQQGRRRGDDAAHSRRDRTRGAEGGLGRDPGRRLQCRQGRLHEVRHRHVLRVGRDARGTDGRQEDRPGDSGQDHLRDPGAGAGPARGPVRRCEAGQSRHRGPVRQRAGSAVGAADHRGEAAAGPVGRQRRGTGRRHRAGRAEVEGRRRQPGQRRDLRPERRRRQADPERWHRILRRPAALRAGLHGGHRAVAEPEQRQRHRRWGAGADRSVHRRQEQHRQDHPLHGEQHAVVLIGGAGASRLPRPSPQEQSMSSSVVTEPSAAPPTSEVPVREPRSFVSRLLARPEIGALAAAIVIFLFFYAVAPTFRTFDAASTYLYASSTIGIVAVGVAMLMIGGEFDLSAGVAVTTAALCTGMICYELSLNVWAGVVISLAVALAIGFVNGYLVVRTGIPSFLVTLSTFFILQGLNLGVTKLVTGAVASPDISQLDGFSSARAVFASSINLGFMSLNITVLWWILFVAVGTWLLLRTRVGNWIFASGGNEASARAVGVPVRKVKIGLFMTVGFLAWFLGMHLLFNFSTVQAGIGVGNEFIYIIAAVVGGALLTGGYGSALGSALGALIFGMTTQGIVFAGWDPNWFKTFLGAMLLLAVLVNLYVKHAAAQRK